MKTISESSRPLVSVIIPVYNLEDYVGRAIESLRAQTFGDFEAVIVDDGSTDDSAEAISEAAGDDLRFVTVHKSNEGVSAARRTGLERARGRYVCFLDGDDWWEPDFLERMTSAAAGGECDIVCCEGYIRVCAGYRTVVWSRQPAEQSGGGYAREMLCGRATAALWDKLYDRRLFDDGLVFYDVKVAEDLLLNLQILCRRPKIRTIGYAGYNYLQRGGSAVHTLFTLDDCKMASACVDDVFARNAGAAAEMEGERLSTMRGVWWYCRYVERSRNRWAGDDEFVRRLRVRASECRELLRRELTFGDRAMFGLDRWRICRPAVLTVSTFRRWQTSLSRRFAKSFRQSR